VIIEAGEETYCSVYEERERSINLTAGWAETETFKFGGDEVVGGVQSKDEVRDSRKLGPFFSVGRCPNGVSHTILRVILPHVALHGGTSQPVLVKDASRAYIDASGSRIIVHPASARTSLARRTPKASRTISPWPPTLYTFSLCCLPRCTTALSISQGSSLTHTRRDSFDIDIGHYKVPVVAGGLGWHWPECLALLALALGQRGFSHSLHIDFCESNITQSPSRAQLDLLSRCR
jgi:hypothetical protein